MSTKGKTKRKKVLERKNKDAAKKITMIVIGLTIVVMILMYFMYKDGM